MAKLGTPEGLEIPGAATFTAPSSETAATNGSNGAHKNNGTADHDPRSFHELIEASSILKVLNKGDVRVVTPLPIVGAWEPGPRRGAEVNGSAHGAAEKSVSDAPVEKASIFARALASVDTTQVGARIDAGLRAEPTVKAPNRVLTPRPRRVL